MMEPNLGIRWYAVMSGPQMEFEAEVNLRRQGYYTWLPHERIKRKRKIANRDRYKIEIINTAYFPRYLFVCFRSPRDSFYQVNETDGVATIVYCGDEPLPIPHEVMDELMARADVNGMVGEVDKVARKRFKPGQKVKFIDESPLAGWVATVSLDAGKDVRVFLEMLGKIREVPVDATSLTAA